MLFIAFLLNSMAMHAMKKNMGSDMIIVVFQLNLYGHTGFGWNEMDDPIGIVGTIITHKIFNHVCTLIATLFILFVLCFLAFRPFEKAQHPSRNVGPYNDINCVHYYGL